MRVIYCITVICYAYLSQNIVKKYYSWNSMVIRRKYLFFCIVVMIIFIALQKSKTCKQYVFLISVKGIMCYVNCFCYSCAQFSLKYYGNPKKVIFSSDYCFINNILFKKKIQLSTIFTKIIINPRKCYSHCYNKNTIFLWIK